MKYISILSFIKEILYGFMEKNKMAGILHFLFFPNVFLYFSNEEFPRMSHFVNSICFQFEKKLSIWCRVSN